MKFEITKKEAELIVYEIVSTFNSIQEKPSRDKFGEFKFKNFHKFKKSDFDLNDAGITDYEFKSFFNLLNKIKDSRLI